MVVTLPKARLTSRENGHIPNLVENRSDDITGIKFEEFPFCSKLKYR